MAKFLSLYVTASGLNGGTRLINADQIVTVAQTAATTTTIQMAPAASTGSDVFTLTHTSTGTVPSVRDAINAAITAVPGGQTVAIELPVDIVCTALALA